VKVVPFKPSERACASMLVIEGEKAFHVVSVASLGCWSSLCLPIIVYEEYCFDKDEKLITETCEVLQVLHLEVKIAAENVWRLRAYVSICFKVSH